MNNNSHLLQYPRRFKGFKLIPGHSSVKGNGLIDCLDISVRTQIKLETGFPVYAQYLRKKLNWRYTDGCRQIKGLIPYTDLAVA